MTRRPFPDNPSGKGSKPDMPRPLEFTPARAAAVLKSLRLGASYEGAANAAGVSARTVFAWKRRGRAGEEPFAAFVAKLDTQRKAWEVTHLRRIEAASKDPKFWKASAFLLQARDPKRYARRLDEAEIVRRVEERLQQMVKHAEEEMRRRMVAGNQQRAIEGKDDGLPGLPEPTR